MISAAQRKGTITCPSAISIAAGALTTEPFICTVNGRVAGTDLLDNATIKTINSKNIADRFIM
jgi:hypothetical protein